MKTRFAEVDLVKAVGILVVILIHSMRSPWNPNIAPQEIWLGHITRFAVPGFLAASGFLYATRDRISFATTRARLLRILTPYLAISIAAQLFRHLRDEGSNTGLVVGDLLLAASFGPYYYVMVIAAFAALTPLFTRLSPQALLGLLVCELGAQLYFEVATPLGLFWHIRNPLLWIAYFHLGWLVRLHYADVRDVFTRHRRLAVAAGAAAVVSLFGIAAWPRVAASPEMITVVSWLAVYAALTLLFALSCGGRPRRSTRGLSEATYAIYLLHLFFVYPVQGAVPAPSRQLDLVALLAPWAAGLVGSLALIAVARRLLGARSRAWIGA